MSGPSRLAAALVLATTAALVAPGPAEAAARPTPGSFTGFAFDACEAPSQAEMDAWLTSSPFWGVGVYLGGANRACDQPNLTTDWVRTQTRKGWKVLPIWVGPQASCASYPSRIDPDPAETYSAARRQGRRQANRAAAVSKALGIAGGSTLWYDLEDFDLQESADCRRSALAFLSAWTTRLHQLGLVSGVYANVASAVAALDFADAVDPDAYTEPDRVWYAWANGRADTAISSKWVRASSWSPHRRIHQYVLDVVRSYGGVSLTVDLDFMDVGRGSVAPKAAASCGVRVDFAKYRLIRRGDSGPLVKGAQCLLRQQGYYVGRVSGRFGPATARATRQLQRAVGLDPSGRMNRRSWTALHAAGTRPVLKRGSASNAVRRLQRAMNAAGSSRLPVTGVFGASTTRAVRAYQAEVGLPGTGVVARDTWLSLRAGRR